MKKKWMTWILCGLLCTMTGCGSGNEENISEMSGKEMLVIGMDCAQKPFSFETDMQNENSVVLENGYVDGFDVRLARYLTKTMNREIQIVKMADSEIAAALEEGTIDLAVSALSVQDSKEWDLSSPYYKEGFAAVVRKNDKLAEADSVSALANKTLMSLSDSAADRAIDTIKDAKHGAACGDLDTLGKALKDKQCDAMILPQSMAKAYVKADKDAVMMSFAKDKGIAGESAYVIVLPEEAAEEEEGLYKEVEAALSNLQDDTKQEWMKAYQ